MIDSNELQKHSLFGGLFPEEVNFVRSLMEERTYREGDCAIYEGDPNTGIYFILDGSVEVLRQGQRIKELSEGDFFGEMEMLSIMPSAASVRALSPLHVACISNRALHAIYKKDSKMFALILMNLARDLSRRLLQIDACIAERYA